MSINVTLVNPPYPERGHHHPPFITIGLGYLGAVLEKNGYKVNIIDCQAQKFTLADFEREISKYQPRIVGITSTTLTYNSARKVAEIAKKVHPNCLTVLGGCHVTFWDDKALEECPALDMAVRREGEYTFLEIADRVKEGKPLKNVVGTTCREDGKIIRNADRPYIQNLDELPVPAYHLFPIESFRRNGKVIFPMLASRGCVYCCDFCTAVRMFGQKHRARSPKNVVDEIEFVTNKYGNDQFTFYDDLFTLDPAWVKEICKEIRSRNLKIKWDCETRLDMVTKELLLEMRKAGCNEVSFGVESGCQRILDAVHKRVSIQQCENAIKWAKDEGLFVAVSTIVGYPGETKETMKQTLDLIHRIEPDDVWLCLATPYPGTELRALIESMGWKMSSDWTLYNTMNPIFEIPDLPAEEISKMRKSFYAKFYSPRYILRQLVKGYVKGNFYSKIMARTSANYLIWRLKSGK